MTKSTKKSDLKGKKVSVVGHGDVSKAVITSPVPLEQENSNEDKVSQRNSSKPVPEEETPRSGTQPPPVHVLALVYTWRRALLSF